MRRFRQLKSEKIPWPVIARPKCACFGTSCAHTISGDTCWNVSQANWISTLPSVSGSKASAGADHFVIFPERPGPTVREDQRLGIGPLAAHVDEVDRHPVDLGAELRISIHRVFVLAPVVALDPVGDQLLEVGGVGAVLPAIVCEVVDPACELEARLQIVEHFIGYIDAKRTNRILVR